MPRGSSPSQQPNRNRGAHRLEAGMRWEAAITAARGQVCSPAPTLQPGPWGPRRDFCLPRGRRAPGRKCRGSRPLGRKEAPAPAAASRASLAGPLARRRPAPYLGRSEPGPQRAQGPTIGRKAPARSARSGRPGPVHGRGPVAARRPTPAPDSQESSPRARDAGGRGRHSPGT